MVVQGTNRALLSDDDYNRQRTHKEDWSPQPVLTDVVSLAHTLLQTTYIHHLSQAATSNMEPAMLLMQHATHATNHVSYAACYIWNPPCSLCSMPHMKPNHASYVVYHI